uniref:Uncharacterized protein n=1 Tax=Physcomitrium patens TaxID=3218 RepID=A0A2K1K8G9_PHYPA|nr:hypothetical protein PHYPA_011971 [Physcomitrium patens]
MVDHRSGGLHPSARWAMVDPPNGDLQARHQWATEARRSSDLRRSGRWLGRTIESGFVSKGNQTMSLRSPSTRTSPLLKANPINRSL